MQQGYSLTELADVINRWCADNGVRPANGQAADALTERNLRFYRTVGLLDAPVSGGGRGYGEKHRRQLVAVRLLQARGLPLRRIRELLHGRSLDELAEVETRAMEEQTALTPEPEPLPPAAAGSHWKAHQIGEDFLLLSLNHRQLPASALQKIRQILTALPFP